MIQKEFRLVCRGIQLISVLELDETTKNLSVTLLRHEQIKEATNLTGSKSPSPGEAINQEVTKE